MVQLFGDFQDPKPLLDKMAAAVRKHRSVSGILRRIDDGTPLRFKFLAPNCLLLEGPDLFGQLISDGTSSYELSLRSKLYRPIDWTNASAGAMTVPGYGLLIDTPFDLLALWKKVATSAQDSTIRFDFQSLVIGAAFLNRQWPRVQQHFEVFGMDLYLDPDTDLPVRIHGLQRGMQPVENYRYEKIVLDPPLTRADFKFAPEKGFRRDEDLLFSLRPITEMDIERSTRSLHPNIFTPGSWQELDDSLYRASPTWHRVGSRWVLDVDVDVDVPKGRPSFKNLAATVRLGEEDWRTAAIVPTKDPNRWQVLVQAMGTREPERLRLEVKDSINEVVLFAWPK